MRTDFLYQGYYIFKDENGYFYNSRYWGKTYVELKLLLEINGVKL